MSAFIDITGQKFHRWTVKEHLGGSNWLCICECGTEKRIFKHNLIRGLSKSCGCLKVELMKDELAANAGKIGSQSRFPPELREERIKAALEKRRSPEEREKKRLYREANKERLSEGQRRCYEAKRDEYIARIKRNYDADPEQYISRARRKTTLIKEATPPWADIGAIKELYVLARFLSKATGIKHEVDHIVPLTSSVVCGLHCEGNLRVITKKENRRKTNKVLEDIVSH